MMNTRAPGTAPRWSSAPLALGWYENGTESPKVFSATKQGALGWQPTFAVHLGPRDESSLRHTADPLSADFPKTTSSEA